MSKNKGTALKFVKVKSIDQIPRYLFEQVKDREFDIDRLYDWGPVLLNNPMNLLGAYIDKEQIVKGVMWTSFNPITNKLTVHVLSVDKEYQGKGILKEARGIVNKLKKNVNAETIDCLTSRPVAISRRTGFKESKYKIMEM